MSETSPIADSRPRDVFAEPVDVAWRLVDSAPGGLAADEAARRRDAAAAPRRRRSSLALVAGELVESLVEPLQLLLLVVGALSAIFGEIRNAIAIFAIVGLVSAVEAISEARARRALQALRALGAPVARVRRGGAVSVVPAADVVAGDELLVEAGDVVAADARVAAADGLTVDESALTGEPVAQAKGADPAPPDAPLAERSSMLYAGTAATAGSGAGVVVAVGDDSEIGRLGRLVAATREPPTPLQRAMRELARGALVIAVAASVLVPLVGVLRGRPVREMLLDGLTLAFATIPEELPILVTVLVAVGGLRLARRGVLLRRLRSAEAVGAVTVLLTDKTGTLTENRLRLELVEGDRARVLAAAVAAHGGAPAQDPLDRALAGAAEAAGVGAPGGPAVRAPFDPVRKRESAVWGGGGRVPRWVAVKGAPEAVLDVCAVGDSRRREVLRRVDELAADGLRVLAVAERRGEVAAAEPERGLEFVGLAAFGDPLRDGVPEAVRRLGDAGVRTIVVSGDHPRTVRAVAAAAGLRVDRVLMGGAALEAVGDDELAAVLREDVVVARATPEDKLRLVRLLQGRGEAVAVTGDGVNDAPALAAADVGIAMGARGTDLAREAADLVLTDDAYPTIVAAVAGGRGVTAQLRRAVAFYLGAKVALVAVIAVPLAAGLPSPFDPVHIVLLELFMDLGASVAFVSEPASPDAMRRPPRDPARRFLDRPQLSAIALVAVALVAGVLPAYLLVRPEDGTEIARAAAVAAWLIAHAAIAWCLRARTRLPWRENVAFPSWALIAAATAIVFALTPAADALGIAPLTAYAVGITVAMVAAGVLVAAAGRRALVLPRRL